APVVQDQGVGYHRVGCLGAHTLALPHAVANDLAAAKLHLFTVNGEVLFNFQPQLGIGQAHAVAHGGAEHIGVGTPVYSAHQRSPITSPRKPYTRLRPESST